MNILKNKVINSGAGLYLDNESYLYKGNVVDNYVEYSGILFRIVGIDSTGRIKIVTEDNMTLLFYNVDNFDESYLSEWLENLDEKSSFLKKIDDKWLNESDYCIGNLDFFDSDPCSLKSNHVIGLLNSKEYLSSVLNGSYLVNGKKWWLLNSNKQGGKYFVDNDGNVSLDYDNSYYGVRPVVVLSSDVIYKSGDGTINNPYRIANNSSKKIGKYISIDNYLWKVIDNDDSKLKLVMVNNLKSDGSNVKKSYSSKYNKYILNDPESIAEYLNTTFYSSLESSDLLLNGRFYNGSYSILDYTNIFSDSIESYVGLLNIGDLFVGEVDEVLMTNSADGKIYVVENGDVLEKDIHSLFSFRPVIYISSLTKLIGDGTVSNPYTIEKDASKELES